MAEGTDLSYSAPNVDYNCLAGTSHGAFVVRYIGSVGSGKNLTAAELAEIKASGMDLGVVIEKTAGAPLLGYNEGVRQAKLANDNLIALGLSTSRPIYFALDIDPNPLTAAQWDAVKAFLNGAADTIGRDRVGFYGGYLAIEKMCPTSAPWAWQTYAWSGGKVSEKNHLYQWSNRHDLCGGVVDYTRSSKPDYGQYFGVEDDPLAAFTEAQIIEMVRSGVRREFQDADPATPFQTVREVVVDLSSRGGERALRRQIVPEGSQSTVRAELRSVSKLGADDALAGYTPPPVDVDEAAIAAAVIAALPVDQLAALLRESVPADVVKALGAKLTAP